MHPKERPHLGRKFQPCEDCGRGWVKQYAPQQFNELRQCQGISSEQLVKSLGKESLVEGIRCGQLQCGSSAMSEAKSGALFITSFGNLEVQRAVAVPVGQPQQWDITAVRTATAVCDNGSARQ